MCEGYPSIKIKMMFHQEDTLLTSNYIITVDSRLTSANLLKSSSAKNEQIFFSSLMKFGNWNELYISGLLLSVFKLFLERECGLLSILGSWNESVYQSKGLLVFLHGHIIKWMNQQLSFGPGDRICIQMCTWSLWKKSFVPHSTQSEEEVFLLCLLLNRYKFKKAPWGPERASKRSLIKVTGANKKETLPNSLQFTTVIKPI